jgi:rod shape-determining protein MreC
MDAQKTPLLRLVLIWLLLETIAAAQVRDASGRTALGSWLAALARPLAATTTWAAELGSDLVFGLRDHSRLVSETRRLRHEVEDCRARSLLLREDLLALREVSLLENVVDGLEADCISARATYRNLALGRMYVTAGRSRHVHRDTPALGAGGLVGRVVHSLEGHSWIELIIHPAAAVAVHTPDGGLQALATGSGSAQMRVQFVPRDAQLVRGAILVTSGADEIYPPGIPVARVSTVRESDDPFLDVIAVPTADLATLRVVLLLPRWTRAQASESLQ